MKKEYRFRVAYEAPVQLPDITTPIVDVKVLPPSNAATYGLGAFYRMNNKIYVLDKELSGGYKYKALGLSRPNKLWIIGDEWLSHNSLKQEQLGDLILDFPFTIDQENINKVSSVIFYCGTTSTSPRTELRKTAHNTFEGGFYNYWRQNFKGNTTTTINYYVHIKLIVPEGGTTMAHLEVSAKEHSRGEYEAWTL